MTQDKALRAAPLHIIGRFAAASNATLLVQLLVDDSEAFAGEPNDAVRQLASDQLAVYKPAVGEAPLWDFPAGTLHRREVAAYIVSDWLELDLVPMTVLRDDGPAGPGSVQQFVPHDPQQHYFTLREDADPRVQQQLLELVVFDMLVNNADRKGGHVLLSATTGDIRAVDHGVCFHVEPKLRTVAWDYAGDRIPRAVIDRLRQAAGRIDVLRRQLDGLLADDEVIAFVDRLMAIIDRPEFARPTGERPVPWPLI